MHRHTKASSMVHEKRLVLYSDMAYLPEGVRHCEMLFPFWGVYPEPAEWRDMHRFDEYVRVGGLHFEMTDNINNADIAVLPADWKRYVRSESQVMAMKFAEKARHSGKKLVVLFSSDSDDTVPLDSAIILRTSLYKSRRHRDELALPAFCGDALQIYRGGELQSRPKRRWPVVGFCGYARSSKNWALDRIGSLFGGDKHIANKIARDPLSLRSHVLNLLSRHSRIESNFVVRNAYFNGMLRSDGNKQSFAASARKDYYENVFGSDYIVCIRGGGNYSFRFYEAMCCGKIPIFVDTDCVLPFEHKVDWKRLCVWIDLKDIEHIGDKVAEFHNELTEAEFIELQRENRRVWKDMLSPEGFFGSMSREWLV